MSAKANRCRLCGRYPRVVPYSQSIDGNHDTPSSVVCSCGNSVHLNFDIWDAVVRRFRDGGMSQYCDSSAYLSKEFTDAVTDAVVDIWNGKNHVDSVCCEIGSYECQELAFVCDCCGHSVYVDRCILREIRDLHGRGIRTLGSCCGHMVVQPSVVVNPRDRKRMLELGYEQIPNDYGACEFRLKSECPSKD